MRRGFLLLTVVLLQALAPHAAAAEINGDSGQDLLAGTTDGDVIRGLGNGDTLFGRGGKDTLFGDGDIPNDDDGPSFAPDFVLGGAGADTFNEGDNQPEVFGRVIDDDSTGRDVLKGGPGPDFLFSADGAADTVDCGRHSNDFAVVDRRKDTVKNCETVLKKTGDSQGAFSVVVGTNDPDDVGIGTSKAWVFGLRGDDILDGGANEDWIFPGSGEDDVTGGDSSDQIFDDDGIGGDLLRGGLGNDFIYSVDGAADSIVCDEGTDIAFFDEGLDDVSVSCETQNPL